MKPVIIVLDDDAQFRKRMVGAFPTADYSVSEAATLPEGIALLKKPDSWPALIVLDAMFPKEQGARPTYSAPQYIEQLTELSKGRSVPYVILVSLAEETPNHEKQIVGWLADRTIAFFLAKSTADIGWQVFQLSLRLLTERLLHTRKWTSVEMIDSREDPQAFLGKHGIIGIGSAFVRLAEQIHFLAERRPTLDVLICGPPGTGKELVAQALHAEQCERTGPVPLVAASCRDFPPELAQSTLFGHVKGAFTGAEQNKIGLFTQAKGGVLLLDELQSLNLADQQVLLRALDPGEYTPLGGKKDHKECRVIAATSADLKFGKTDLRPDLLDRLYIIHMPSLSERLEDCDTLIARFVEEYNKTDRTNVFFAETVLRVMRSYTWPGNIRELKRTINVLMGWAVFYKRNTVDLPLLEAQYPHILYARPAEGSLISSDDPRLSEAGQQVVRDVLSSKPESHRRVLTALIDQRHGMSLKDLVSPGTPGLSRTHLNENILPDLIKQKIVLPPKSERGTTTYAVDPALLR